jgi:uncharacterized protein (DUF305 family)
MSHKTITFIIALACLICGLTIGYTYNAKDVVHTSHDGVHQMPDGSFMSNNPDTKNENSMSQMMHDMNMALVGKSGDAFDKVFLEEMIVHHQGAVEMAELVLKVSKRPELLKLANDIIKAQNTEITQMQTWQSEWFK